MLLRTEHITTTLLQPMTTAILQKQKNLSSSWTIHRQRLILHNLLQMKKSSVRAQNLSSQSARTVRKKIHGQEFSVIRQVRLSALTNGLQVLRSALSGTALMILAALFLTVSILTKFQQLTAQAMIQILQQSPISFILPTNLLRTFQFLAASISLRTAMESTIRFLSS